MTPIDPTTGKPGKRIQVPDVYNMYFTPDGGSAVVVVEGLKRLEFRDPQTMALKSTLAVSGRRDINHADPQSITVTQYLHASSAAAW